MNKRVLILLSVLAFLALIGFTSASSAYYEDYSDVLLVCNDNSSQSQEICSYFIEKRDGSLGFNESHVMNLTNITTNETTTDSEYSKIFNQTQEKLNNISGEINYIVTTKGVPLRTGRGHDCVTLSGGSLANPKECRSIDARLMADLGANSNYYSKSEVFTNSKNGGYLATRITGIDVSDAKELIDSSKKAIDEGLKGKALINCYKSSDSGEDFDNGKCSSANTTIHDLGYEADYNNSGFVTDRKNLSSYASWGSNANDSSPGCGKECKNSSDWNLSFNAGAIGETFVSTSARTFDLYPWDGSGPYSGQSLISDLIHYNITGVKGYVYEPNVKRIADINLLWDRYLKGYNLADSYYMASEYRNYTGVVVGDPKTYVEVSENASKPQITLENSKNNSKIKKGKILNFSINKSVNKPFFAIQSSWYEDNKEDGNITLNSSEGYIINTSSWEYKEKREIVVYSNDTNGNLSKKLFVLEVKDAFNTTNKFNNSLSGEILSFSGAKNITRYMELPKNAEVNNATINVKGLSKLFFPNPFGEISQEGIHGNNSAHLDSEGPKNISNKASNYSTGGLVKTSPAIHNGSVYVGSSDGKLYRFDSSNISNLIESYDTGNNIESSPLILKVDGKNYVYVGNNDGYLFKFDAKNISEGPIENYSTSNSIKSSPTYSEINGNKYVYFGSNDNSIYQLNASNISQKVSSYNAGSSVENPVAIENGFVYAGDTGNNIRQLNASNISQEISSYSGSGPVGKYSVTASKDYVYGSNGLLSDFVQLNSSNVSQKISSFSTGSFFISQPALKNDYVYVGNDDNKVYQLNASDVSQEIASFSADSYVRSSPVLTNKYVYIGSDDNKLYQLNASNVSKKISEFSTGNPIKDSVSITKNYAYIGSNDNEVYQLGGFYKNPSNPYIEVGSVDGNREWNYSGNLSGQNSSKDFSSALNNALSDSCSGGILESGNCSIPFMFHSESTGKLKYSGISANWSLKPTSGKKSSGSPSNFDNGNGISYLKKSHGWQKISPGEEKSMNNFGTQIGIEEIKISVKEESKNVQIEVKQYDSKPEKVSMENEGKTYKYFEINSKNLEDKLDKASVMFRIPIDWVSENNLTSSNISAYKFNKSSERWNELETIYSNSGEEKHFYDVELKRFSYFSIGEKSVLDSKGKQNFTAKNGMQASDNDPNKGKKDRSLHVVLAIAFVLFVIGFILKDKIKYLIKKLFS